ncbi:MAG: YdcF family protein [Firmicutes bacterium]|nr:YdcF family protein [Bacillota bacterium]
MNRIKRFFGMVVFVLIMAAALAGITGMTINNHVVNSQKGNILGAITDTKDDFLQTEYQDMKKINADCIMILGAGIIDAETPSPMLKDRLDTGILLYQNGVAPKILLTGDNGTEEHNEIHVMLNYVKNAGVPESDIFCDHAGFSTYDSMYRAKSIFEVESCIVVTQTYHEYRALYIAEKLNLTAKGIAADQERYSGQPVRELREVLARIKDFGKCIVKPAALLGGEAIPISGSGIPSHGE